MEIKNLKKAITLIDNRSELLKMKRRILEQNEMSINGLMVSNVWRKKAKKFAIEFINKEIQRVEEQIRSLK